MDVGVLDTVVGDPVDDVGFGVTRASDGVMVGISVSGVVTGWEVGACVGMSVGCSVTGERVGIFVGEKVGGNVGH
jgi:hypothetical protein